MQRKGINELSEQALWLMLGDIAILLGERHHQEYAEVSDYWLSLSDEIKNELDNRLILKGGL